LSAIGLSHPSQERLVGSSHRHGVNHDLGVIFPEDRHDLQDVPGPVWAEVKDLARTLLIGNDERMGDCVADVVVADPMLAGRLIDVHCRSRPISYRETLGKVPIDPEAPNRLVQEEHLRTFQQDAIQNCAREGASLSLEIPSGPTVRPTRAR